MSYLQNAETQNNISDAEDEIVFPPSDLLSDEPPMETEFHLRQMILLIQCLEFWWQCRQDFYACGNMTIYYSPRQRKSEQFRGPDFFVVLGTDRKPRKSWVVWEEEGKYPNLIVEILSPATASTDRGLKKQIYQDIFRTPEYFWFDPITNELKGFQLMGGIYQELLPDAQGWLWSQQLQLHFGVHQSQLRFFTPDGQLISTPEEAAAEERERAEQERERAEQERERAEQERERADRLAEKLRELGIDPSQL